MKYKREKSAGGIVYKKPSFAKASEGKEGQVLWLITQHSQHKGWSFPKGLIGDEQRDEKMETAAVREVKEEGGIDAKIVSPIPVETRYKYRSGELLVDKTVYYFLMEYVSGDPKDHDWEVSDARFVAEEDVKKTLSFKSDKAAFKSVLTLYKKLV